MLTHTNTLYSYEVLRFFATFDGYLYSEGYSILCHADDIAILCSIGHEVAHVICRIHVILTTPTNGLFTFFCICEKIDLPDL